jgi:hypothetical protein
MMHFMKGMALPFSAAKEWLEVVGKAFRFLGYHRFYPPVLKKSRILYPFTLYLGIRHESNPHVPRAMLRHSEMNAWLIVARHIMLCCVVLLDPLSPA